MQVCTPPGDEKKPMQLAAATLLLVIKQLLLPRWLLAFSEQTIRGFLRASGPYSDQQMSVQKREWSRGVSTCWLISPITNMLAFPYLKEI